MLLSVNSLEKRFDSTVLFSGLSFTLEEGHRVALVGKNGAGKSTLMKIIAGKESPSSGTVTIPQGRTVSYLPQEVADGEERTGIAYIQEGLSVQPHEFFPVLNGLGISQEVAERSLVSMSGGQQTKILLTRFLLEPSDVLLLDEPTNNLDIPSLLWLETYLASLKKAMVIISHDLAFLDTVANRVIELKNRTITLERGTYSDYITRKEKEFIRDMKAYTQYVQKVQQLERTRKNLQEKGRQIDATDSSDSEKVGVGVRRDRASAGQRGVKALDKRIKRLEVVEKPFEESRFTLPVQARQEGDVEIAVSDMVAGYPDGVQVGPVSFTLKLGDRLCLMGMNGAGKSTVLKTIVGSLKPVSGDVAVRAGVLFGDLLQHHERANRDDVVIDFFIHQTNSDTEKAMHMLKQAGFTEQMMQGKIVGLSSGMRARLLFAVFIVLGVNVLILDEPTNHLDIEAVTALKELLKEYKGIVLLVSHNRWFLEDLAVGSYYMITQGEMRRIQDFKEYVAEAQEQARKMVRQMKRILA